MIRESAQNVKQKSATSKIWASFVAEQQEDADEEVLMFLNILLILLTMFLHSSLKAKLQIVMARSVHFLEFHPDTVTNIEVICVIRDSHKRYSCASKDKKKRAECFYFNYFASATHEILNSIHE